MNSLTELKQVIDSMESRIEDDIVDTFQRQLSIIGEQYTDQAGVIIVIKMMQSIGRYLGSKKENADKDALPVLNSIFIALERLVQSPDSTKEESNSILSECIQYYNSLKNKIAFQPLVTSTEMQDLKAVILAVDWEISEITLKTFDTVTSRILTRLKPHKIHHTFLRIIHSMGRYIASKKSAAHKDSIFFLRSVFDNFEQIVQTPDMPFQEKKQLIESDIAAFHNFKRGIAPLKETTPVSTDEIEDEIIQPALSHVKVSHTPVAEDVVPLTPLSETSFPEQSPDAENPAPALAGKKRIPPAPVDIMDDLFSGKESPADELLDAIHLANIHGPDQKRAMNMGEPTKEELQRDGLKNLTPHRMENEPIPEIGDRLDEFFNLDISEGNNETAGSENDQPIAIVEDNDVPAPDDSSMEAVVPFQHEEDSFDENPDEESPDENNFDKGDPTQGVINRLKLLGETHDGLLDDNLLIAIDEDLSYLKRLWQDDPDKTMLLNLTSWLLIKKGSVPVAADTNPMDDETPSPLPEQLDKPPLSFWGRIKSIFFK